MQVGGGLYYSFIVVRGDNRSIAKEARFNGLAEICTELHESFKRTDLSLGWKYPSTRVSFRAFNDANAFALAEPVKRQNYIDERVAEIKELIRDFEARRGNRALEPDQTQPTTDG